MFGNIQAIDIKNVTCHSGGASGSDTLWEMLTLQYGGKCNAYSYNTKYHTSENKIEISEKDYQEGIKEVYKANKIMNRQGINKVMDLLARDWTQVKYSNQIIAIGHIVKQGERGKKGYLSNATQTVVDGGTGYGVTMGIIHKKPTFVYEQEEKKWYRWSYNTNDFIETNEDNVYLMSSDFAGIGTRDINIDGEKAILHVFTNTNEKIST